MLIHRLPFILCSLLLLCSLHAKASKTSFVHFQKEIIVQDTLLVSDSSKATVAIFYTDANLAGRAKKFIALAQNHLSYANYNFLLVGISNPKSLRRINHFSPYHFVGKQVDSVHAAQALLDLINDSLITQFQGKYGRFEYMCLYGHSLGGLFASWVFTQKNNPFRTILAASPSCWVNRMEITKDHDFDGTGTCSLHLRPGGLERANLVYRSTLAFSNRLAENTEKSGVENNCHFKPFPMTGHAGTVKKGFQSLLEEII